MTTTTTELSGWLLEQIAEDERKAREAADSIPYLESVPVGRRWTDDRGLILGEPRQWKTDADYAPPLWDCEGANALCMPEEASRHAATWDPARVLAECDAKRRRIELHRPVRRTQSWPSGDRLIVECTVCADSSHEYSEEWSRTEWPCPTLRLEALPYAEAGRPGYREEWRP